MARAKLPFDFISEHTRVGTGEPEIAAPLAIGSADSAETFVFVHANGQNVQRAALIEVTFAFVHKDKGFSLFSDCIGQGDAYLIAPLSHWHVQEMLTSSETTRIDGWSLILNLTTVYLDADCANGIARFFDCDRQGSTPTPQCRP